MTDNRRSLSASLGAGRGGVDEQDLALVGGDQRAGMQLERADARMQYPLAVAEADRDLVLAPELGELRAVLLQLLDEVARRAGRRVAGEDGAQAGHVERGYGERWSAAG